MRNVTLAIATVVSAFALLHCAGGSTDGSTPLDKDNSGTNTSTQDAGTSTTPPKTTPSSPTDAGVKTVADAGKDSEAPPAKGTKETGTAAPGPGPTCTALSACCGKLSNSIEQVGCLLASGKKNELICGGAMITFNCASVTNPSHGPSCSGLTSGAMYCGNDGPGGDANTLYQCNGSNISIVRQCANGCKINDGVDDACAASGGGGGGGGTDAGGGSSSNLCTGYSGSFCGSDQIGGNADTLYNCQSDKIADQQVCANGCVTNPDPTLNDSCASAPPAGGGTGGSGASCTGLPDFKYCGSDGVNGDATTLYTCANGAVTDSTACPNGCTVGSSNTDDYCSFTAGGSGGPDCTGQSDGTYCGANGVSGDPDTLYTCSNGNVDNTATQFCDSGCYAGDYGGSDSCN